MIHLSVQMNLCCHLRSSSELNSEFHSNSDGEPKNSSPNSLVSYSNSDLMYHSHEVSLSQRLAACAIKNDGSRDSVTELLQVLHDEGLELPKDARTQKTFQKCGGDYCYFGIQKGIEQILVHNTLESNSANLVFNIDGLPLFMSSGTQFWF